ncbi:MAG: CBS domain-containing protein, partial [Gemmatimonadetes bacterium]|nr:CBS domain-containing protein [Gemmatimonadota bacterium]
FNLDPLVFGGDCLTRMETQLNALLDKVRTHAGELGTQIVLAGILPTLRQSHLGIENMTPNPRYYALNEALTSLRGSDYDLRIKGADEILVRHGTVMYEACNTSFQVHFQTGPNEFAKLYNVAQAVTPPVMAAATNSPILFGRRLWRETRIALFQQAVDTRSSGSHAQEREARVTFGRRWLDESVLEIFREDIARFRVVLSSELPDDPFADLAKGIAPQLRALRLHNGTVNRWNRPCYGILDGVPHIRIENRVLPAGPSILDEVANAAFWFGLMSGVSDEYADISKVLDFDDVRSDFTAAARLGLDAQLSWVEKKSVPAEELISKVFLPLSREGLTSRGIDSSSIDRYLGVIEERVLAKKTGAHWTMGSLAALKGSLGDRLTAITASMVRNQKEGTPVARWKPACFEDSGAWRHNFLRVEQLMRTDIFTVSEEEIVDLVANLMDWEKIRHVPVEDNQNRLVGLVSHRSLLRYLASDRRSRDESVPVREIMQKNPITTSPDASTLEAMEVMRRARIGCLPVVREGHLVGLLTERDFMEIAGQLIEEKLRESSG